MGEVVTTDQARKFAQVELWTINRVLRRFGLVLVVCTGDDEPTRLWFERSAAYDARTPE